jgi:hypothetical protein
MISLKFKRITKKSGEWFRLNLSELQKNSGRMVSLKFKRITKKFRANGFA